MSTLFENHIPLAKPWLGEEEIQAVSDVLRSGWICQGEKTMEFEKRVAEYVGARFGVATNAATSALHLALRIGGVGPGDKVVVPSFTCMATANAIHQCGAEPLFVDIDARTYNMDPAAVQEVRDEAVRAILIVHQIGLPADADALREMAVQRGWKVVEDAATSLGAAYKGKRLGSLGAPTAFSFHPRKMITTGEGGMIMTDDADFAEKARQLRATGASISDLDRHKARGALVQQYHDFGYNYRMTDIQAAIGIVQMDRLDRILAERRRQAAFYDQAFAGMEEVIPPFVPAYAKHAYSSYMIRLAPAAKMAREELLAEMARQGVSCRIGIQPLHWEPFYQAKMSGLRLPETEQAAATTLFLPIFPGLEEGALRRVASLVRKLVCQGAG